MPLRLFKDRNFALGNVATAALGAARTAQMVPSYFYLQAVRDLSPAKAAVVFAPMAVLTRLLSPFVGKLADRLHPRFLPTCGFTLFTAGFINVHPAGHPHGSIALISADAALLGVASSCIRAPLTATSLRNLPLTQMGAASGVYYTNRQLGSVLGSAGIGALLTARMAAHALPATSSAEGGSTGHVPADVKAPFNAALTDSLYLTAALLMVCTIAAAFFTTRKPTAAPTLPTPTPSATTGSSTPQRPTTDVPRTAS
jgi:MFS family permease